jgi:hypothetical protein
MIETKKEKLKKDLEMEIKIIKERYSERISNCDLALAILRNQSNGASANSSEVRLPTNNSDIRLPTKSEMRIPTSTSEARGPINYTE